MISFIIHIHLHLRKLYQYKRQVYRMDQYFILYVTLQYMLFLYIIRYYIGYKPFVQVSDLEMLKEVMVKQNATFPNRDVSSCMQTHTSLYVHMLCIAGICIASIFNSMIKVHHA